MYLWKPTETRERINNFLDEQIRPVKRHRDAVAYIAVALLEYAGGLRRQTGLPPGGRLLTQQDLIDLMAAGSRARDHVVKGRRPAGRR